MDVMERQFDEEREAAIRQARRQKRRQEIRRRKRRQRMIRRAVFFGTITMLLLSLLVFIFIKFIWKEKEDQKPVSDMEQETLSEPEEAYAEPTAEEPESDSGDGIKEDGEAESMPESRSYVYENTDHTLQLGSEFVSAYAVFVDMDNGTVLAEKGARERMNPASMTKVLTLLVAAEHIEDLDDTFVITADATDYGYVNDCSVAGFEKEETVTVRDLMYGTILPSGADAAMGLALYVSGSQEAFMELMNEKLRELGMSETAHFTNCVGVYDENHYCTVYDLAVIMNAAIENEICREVLSAHTYTTSSTGQHPEGMLLSNWFLRRIEDKDTGGEVVCGKTGFVNQSGSCAVSYGVDQNGRNYICVTAGATSAWRCIYDHVDLYKKFSEIN